MAAEAPTWDLTLKKKSDHSHFGVTVENSVRLCENTYKEVTTDLIDYVLGKLDDLLDIDYKAYQDFKAKDDWSVAHNITFRTHDDKKVVLTTQVDHNQLTRYAQLAFTEGEAMWYSYLIEKNCWNR
jgi:hypothetical protein